MSTDDEPMGDVEDTATAPGPGRATQPGAAVPEPLDELSPELRAQLFKRPIDSRLRAPASPFPVSEEARPREGVRSSIPVMYGRRTENTGELRRGAASAHSIGDPPAGYELPVAARTELPSIASMNRRFGLIAFVGGVGVSAVAVAGVWWIVGQLLP